MVVVCFVVFIYQFEVNRTDVWVLVLAEHLLEVLQVDIAAHYDLYHYFFALQLRHYAFEDESHVAVFQGQYLDLTSGGQLAKE